uniref:SD21670p n=1 Tax=Drosophila melanogaster TaxID=7227 RepID=Q8MRV2_DROME|nr:SD21670p [Drosophila melanogaster]
MQTAISHQSSVSQSSIMRSHTNSNIDHDHQKRAKRAVEDIWKLSI